MTLRNFTFWAEFVILFWVCLVLAYLIVSNP